MQGKVFHVMFQVLILEPMGIHPGFDAGLTKYIIGAPLRATSR
jgi:hypothetical protein